MVNLSPNDEESVLRKLKEELMASIIKNNQATYEKIQDAQLESEKIIGQLIEDLGAKLSNQAKHLKQEFTKEIK